MSSTGPSRLADLVAPTPVTTFLERDWLERALCTHGAVERFGALTALPEAGDLRRLVAAEHECIKATVYEGDGRTRPEVIDRGETLARLERGELRSFTVIRAEQGLPEVKALLRRLRMELPTPQLDAWCNAYFSCAGYGAEPHYDDHEVFILMLRGRKTFTIAPNHGVRFPIAGDGLPPGAWDGPGLPADAERHVLEPGSVLALPRGYWHASKALEDALSFTLAFRSATWLDLVVRQLKRALKEDEAWRTPPRSLRTPEELERRLEALGTVLRSLSSRELLARLVMAEMLDAERAGRRTPGAKREPGA